jgi:hypothetical protein
LAALMGVGLVFPVVVARLESGELTRLGIAVGSLGGGLIPFADLRGEAGPVPWYSARGFLLSPRDKVDTIISKPVQSITSP